MICNAAWSLSVCLSICKCAVVLFLPFTKSVCHVNPVWQRNKGHHASHYTSDSYRRAQWRRRTKHYERLLAEAVGGCVPLSPYLNNYHVSQLRVTAGFKRLRLPADLLEKTTNTFSSSVLLSYNEMHFPFSPFGRVSDSQGALFSFLFASGATKKNNWSHVERTVMMMFKHNVQHCRLLSVLSKDSLGWLAL